MQCLHPSTRNPIWQYFEKFKINVSTRRIQTNSEEFRRYSSFSRYEIRMFGQAASKYTIVLVCVML
jgi:hypothetical protein